MHEIDWEKKDKVYELTKNVVPETASLVKQFDQALIGMDQDLVHEGMQIIHDMLVEAKNQKKYKLYSLNGDMFDFLRRAEKRQRRNHSALIFLPALISQYLFGSQLL